MKKYFYHYLIIVGTLNLCGCDADLFGYRMSIQEQDEQQVHTDRENKLEKVYNVISTGDRENLIIEAMGPPDFMLQQDGAVINTDTYIWKSEQSSYEVNFVYGRVKGKKQTYHSTPP